MGQSILTNLAIGLLSALTTSFGTYVAKMKEGENFDIKKFGRTMAVGLAAGLGSWFVGGNADSVGNLVTTTAGNLGVVNALDQGVKFIWRLFSKKKGNV